MSVFRHARLLVVIALLVVLALLGTALKAPQLRPLRSQLTCSLGKSLLRMRYLHSATSPASQKHVVDSSLLKGQSPTSNLAGIGSQELFSAATDESLQAASLVAGDFSMNSFSSASRRVVLAGWTLSITSLLTACLDNPAAAVGDTAQADAADQSVAQVQKVATVGAGNSAVALNLGSFDLGTPTMPVIDLMKKAQPWSTQCEGWQPSCTGFTGNANSWDTQEESQLDLDSNGWVRSMPTGNAKYTKVSTFMMAGFHPVGQYVVLYDGQGTLTYGLSATKNAAASKAGRDVLDVVSGGGIMLSITATDPSNYIRNIRVLPPGGACKNDLTTYVADASSCPATKGPFVPFESFANTSGWHPAFLADLKGFRALRFMDWDLANDTLLAHWADRPLTTDYTWTKSGGVPLEAQFDLANQAGAEPWINIPSHADDDYVHQFAKLAKAKLASNLHLNIEYGNEPWNTAFPMSQWMMTQATATFGAAAAQVGNTNNYELLMNWYGMRLSQVCDIVKSEFGSDASRVRCIANTLSYPFYQDIMMRCTYAATLLGKPCSSSVDVIAIAPYFGGYLGDATYRSTIDTWTTDSDGGLSKLFQELTGTDANGNAITPPLVAAGSTATQGAIVDAMVGAVASKAVADKYNVPLWAYEGGQGMTIYDNNDADKARALFAAANRDPRMGQAYKTMFKAWQAAGGQTFSFFNYATVYTNYGYWGLKENQFDNSSKWQAVTQLRDQISCWWTACSR